MVPCRGYIVGNTAVIGQHAIAVLATRCDMDNSSPWAKVAVPSVTADSMSQHTEKIARNRDNFMANQLYSKFIVSNLMASNP